LEQLNNVKQEIEELEAKNKIIVHSADITNYNEVEKTFRAFKEDLGLLNGVIANAGRSWRANAHFQITYLFLVILFLIFYERLLEIL